MNNAAKLYLVCGASGFIGANAVHALAAAGRDVVGLGRRHAAPAQLPLTSYVSCDLHDRGEVEKVIAHLEPAGILFAAGVGDVDASVRDPVTDFENQTVPLAHVLWAACKLAVKPRVLLVSSAAVYGNATSPPVSEQAAPSPISPYGHHKLAQERLLDEFHVLYGLPVCAARVFSTYGPGQRRLAVWDITTRALRGDLRLRGTGAESRDYLSGRDVGAALALVARDAPFDGGVVNVASGVETPIRELAAAIHSALGLKAAPLFDGTLPAGYPSRWRADVQRLRGMGFTPCDALDAGLHDTVRWIREHA